MSQSALEKIEQRTAQVAVVGLGYVGLPALLRIAAMGFPCQGLDIDASKVAAAQQAGVAATTDPAVAIGEADVVLICVPTPVDENRKPDYGPVIAAGKSVAPHVGPDTLVILESTVSPGSTEEVLLPLLAEGKSPQEVPMVAHSPERIDPGNHDWDVHNIPRVVAGHTAAAGDVAAAFYETIVDAPIKRMSSLRAAEAVKVVENSFRDINIAFVNELSLGFERLGLDVHEILDGAATKPFGFMRFSPGCGVGGHCIPVDPYYLIEQARREGFEHRFLILAREINEAMPGHAVDLCAAVADEAGFALKSANVTVLGLAYKPGIGDTRESPAIVIRDTLQGRAKSVRTHEPYAPGDATHESIADALAGADIVILATGHDEYRRITPQMLSEAGVRGVVDGRTFWDASAIRAAGIVYRGIGRP